MGQSATGGFKTAPAKEYPRGMCALLARAIAGFSRRCTTAELDPTEHLVEAAFDFCVPWDDFTIADLGPRKGAYGADCAIFGRKEVSDLLPARRSVAQLRARLSS